MNKKEWVIYCSTGSLSYNHSNVSKVRHKQIQLNYDIPLKGLFIKGLKQSTV
jgi:hypothetical protein